MPILAVLVAVVSIAAQAAGQDSYYVQHETVPQGVAGQNVAALDDIDGDGIQDYAYTMRADNLDVRAVSGATAFPLWKALIDDRFPFPFLTPGTLVSCGDLDQDGFSDLLVGEGNTNFTGAVAALSGLTGDVLWIVYGDSFEFFGWSIAAMDDIDGDGIDDWVTGGPKADGVLQGQIGRVSMRSGADGTEIYQVLGPELKSPAEGGTEFGRYVGNIGDQDGDQIDDFVAIGFKSSSSTTGEELPLSAGIFSGVDGLKLGEAEKPVGATGPAREPVDLGDLDGDGLSEFAVTFGGPADGPTPFSGFVSIYRGGDFNVLRVLEGEYAYERIGSRMVVPGDLDGDQIDDLVVSSGFGVQTQPPLWAVLRAYSGADFEPLFTRIPLAPEGVNPAGYGSDLAAIGDLTGDGLDEVLVGVGTLTIIVDGEPSFNAVGGVEILSPVDLELTVSRPLIPTKFGASQALSLDFGPDSAGRPYLMLQSLAGTEVVLLLDGLPLPLTPDAATLLGLEGKGLAQPFTGTLDVEGKATAVAPVPRWRREEQKAVIGTTIWHVALAIDPAGFVAEISNASPMTFKPPGPVYMQ